MRCGHGDSAYELDIMFLNAHMMKVRLIESGHAGLRL